MTPGVGLLDVAANPYGHHGREETDQKDGAPAKVRHDEGYDSCRERIADRPGALHEAKRLRAVLRRPGLRDERCPRCPFPSHTEPKQHTADRKFRDILNEGAQPCEDAVD